LKKILIISTAPTQFKSLLNYATILKNNFEVEFYFDDTKDEIREEVIISDKLGFKYNFHLGSPYAKRNNISTKSTFTKPTFWQKILFKLFPKNEIVGALNSLKAQEDYVATFINTNKPDVILTCEDNCGCALLFIKEAKKKNIKTVVSVFTLANEQELGYVYSKLSNFYVKGFVKQFFYSCFNKWKINYKGIIITCEILPQVIAKEIFKIAPKNPWISVGGNSDYIAIESEFVKEYYLNSGADKKKMKLVPHPALENFQHRMNSKLFYIEELKKNFSTINNQPILLCSLPPDYFANKTFSNYKEIIDFWITTLTKQNTYQIWLSLHPRQNLNSIEYLNNYPVTIVKEPIENLIPLCDVFVAQYSATIRLALMCEKYVINYDMFDANYTEYANCKLVNTISTKEHFEKAIIDFTKSSVPVLNKEPNSYFGNFCEKPNKKITSFFDSL
jgi:hypothetical protein